MKIVKVAIIVLLLLSSHKMAAGNSEPNLEPNHKEEFPQKHISTGTTIKGTILEPIVWTNDSDSLPVRSVIRLKEALFYSDNSVAVPQGASLTVELSKNNIIGSQTATLDAIAISYQNSSGKTLLHFLSEESLSVKSEDGHLLKFETSQRDRLLGNIVSEGTQRIGIRSVGDILGSAVRKTVRERNLNSRYDRDTVHSIEAQTPVTVYINNIINLK